VFSYWKNLLGLIVSNTSITLERQHYTRRQDKAKNQKGIPLKNIKEKQLILYNPLQALLTTT
jgi:hypothetical protein